MANRLYRCCECDERKTRASFDTYRESRTGYMKRQSRCRDCNSAATLHRRSARQEKLAGFLRNLERCRRYGCTLEPHAIEELWGGAAHEGAYIARQHGYADVIDEGWEWEGGRIRVAGAGVDANDFWTGVSW